VKQRRPISEDAYWPARDLRPKPPALLALLRAAVRDPDLHDSVEQFERHHHDDVPYLDLDAIDQERFRLRLVWAFNLLSEWGHERLTQLDRERDKRERDKRTRGRR
jgi:hypothetical protein